LGTPISQPASVFPLGAGAPAPTRTLPPFPSIKRRALRQAKEIRHLAPSFLPKAAFMPPLSGGQSPHYFLGGACACGGCSLLGGTRFFMRMYVARLP
jgi:hypothetical protein